MPWISSVDAANGALDLKRQDREHGMVERNRKKWIWSLPAIWGLAVAVPWVPYAEILTGMGWTGYARWVLLHVVWSSLATVLLVHLRWRILATFMFAVGLFLAVPMPSMAGVGFQLRNPTADDIKVLIWRTRAT